MATRYIYLEGERAPKKKRTSEQQKRTVSEMDVNFQISQQKLNLPHLDFQIGLIVSKSVNVKLF